LLLTKPARGGGGVLVRGERKALRDKAADHFARRDAHHPKSPFDRFVAKVEASPEKRQSECRAASLPPRPN